MTWDFATTFPPVRWDSPDAYRVFGEEPDQAVICGVHQETRAEIAGYMLDLRQVLLAQAEGYHPSTGKTPTTDKQRKELDDLFKTEPERLTAAIEDMLAAYVDVFGEEAGEAFRTHCEQFADRYWEPVQAAPKQLTLF